MQRGGPLRRTPLARQGAPAARQGAAKARKALPAQSARTKAQAQARSELRWAVLQRDPFCRAPGCRAESCDVHEVLTRGRGGSPLDLTNCIGLCRKCHQYVTEHPAWAASVGLVRHAGY